MISLFRYPGGKTKLAKQIAGNVIDFLVRNPGYEYREPFFGGGSIGLFLLSQPHVKLWINDKDVGIASIWNAIITDVERLFSLIDEFQPTPDAFYEFQTFLKRRDLDSYDVVEVGFKKLAIHQISYSGLGTKSGGPLGGTGQQSGYKIDCRWNPKTLKNKINRIRRPMLKKLRGSTCTSHDFEVLLTSPGRFVAYLDPPYYVKGEELYEKSFKLKDHKRLRDLLKKLQQPWMLSYDDCAEIRDLYRWADCRETSANYSITNSREKTELIITPKDDRRLTGVNPSSGDLFPMSG
jgi:DNA adenine methylase